jgi:hypothetical protein
MASKDLFGVIDARRHFDFAAEGILCVAGELAEAPHEFRGLGLILGLARPSTRRHLSGVGGERDADDDVEPSHAAVLRLDLYVDLEAGAAELLNDG